MTLLARQQTKDIVTTTFDLMLYSEKTTR